MQNVTNDIKSENLEKNHSSVSNAIKNSSETLAHVLNFTRKNLNNLIVIKKYGSIDKKYPRQYDKIIKNPLK